jgi:hypothetical protein
VLAALNSPDAPLFRRARLGRAAAELHQLAETLRPRLVALAAQNRDYQRRLDTEQAEATRRRRRFASEVEQALDRFLVAFATAAGHQGEKIAVEIAASSLKRDESYGLALSAALRTEFESAFRTLRKELKTSARAHGQEESSGLSRLERLLAPGDVNVAVPQTQVSKGGVAAGAAAGAAVGTVVPVIGTFFGAIVGVVASGGIQAKIAHDKDVEGAKANVRAASAEVVTQMRGRRSKGLNLIEDVFPATVLSARPPDVASERRLDELTKTLEAMAAAAGGQT